MNTQELIDGIINLSYENYKYSPYVERKRVLELVSQLNEPQPIKLKDVIARIKGFEGGIQKVWLNEILNELGSDYGALKYKEGYKQGKFEGEWVGKQLENADKVRQELNKPTIPRFIADWIEYCKNTFLSLVRALMMKEVDFGNYANQKDHSLLIDYFSSGINQETFVRAWLDGYEVEKEKRYIVKVKGVEEARNHLNCRLSLNEWFFSGESEPLDFRVKHTRQELEKAGFEWVFDCPGIEVEEVE